MSSKADDPGPVEFQLVPLNPDGSMPARERDTGWWGRHWDGLWLTADNLDPGIYAVREWPCGGGGPTERGRLHIYAPGKWVYRGLNGEAVVSGRTSAFTPPSPEGSPEEE